MQPVAIRKGKKPTGRSPDKNLMRVASAVMANTLISSGANTDQIRGRIAAQLERMQALDETDVAASVLLNTPVYLCARC